jgi:hypothetical protein
MLAGKISAKMRRSPEEKQPARPGSQSGVVPKRKIARLTGLFRPTYSLFLPTPLAHHVATGSWHHSSDLSGSAPNNLGE